MPFNEETGEFEVSDQVPASTGLPEVPGPGFGGSYLPADALREAAGLRAQLQAFDNYATNPAPQESSEQAFDNYVTNPAPQESSDAYGLSFFPFEQTPDLPAEPEPGTVIGFTKRYAEDGPGYSFAGIHVARLGWYLTGPNYAGHPVTWETLLDFIGGPAEWAAVGVVTGWTPLVGA